MVFKGNESTTIHEMYFLLVDLSRPQKRAAMATFMMAKLSADCWLNVIHYTKCRFGINYTGCPKKKYPDLVDPSDKNIA